MALFPFSWDGKNDVFGLPVETATAAPPDVAARQAGTLPTVTRSPRSTGGLPVPLAPQQARALATSGALVDPRERPPKGCLYFDLPQNRLPVALGPGASVALAVTPAVPLGYAGIVRYLAFVPADAANAQFTTRVNTSPVLPFQLGLGAVGAMADPTRMFIELAPGDVFDLFVTNLAGVAQDVMARVICWFWPEN